MGALSRPLIVAAVVVNSAATMTMLLWHPDRFLLHQLEVDHEFFRARSLRP